MKHRLLFATFLAVAAGAVQAAPPLAAPMAKPEPAKGVKCGDSYIAAGQVCHKAPAPKGVKCGDSYIAVGQVCHKDTMPAAPAKPAAAPAKPMMAKPAKTPVAAKGKKCGNSYIAANAVCTKK